MRLKKHFLLVILVFAFIVRLYGFTNPIADWHSWRQADTSAVSRHFVQNGYDILHPHFDDLSNIPSGMDNLQGYRFVEFPLYNLLQAGLYDIVGVLTLEEWGRLVTILFSVAGVYFLYRIVKFYSDEKTALLSSFFYAFLPYSIYYGRVILPDTAMVSTALGGVFFFILWAQSKVKDTKKWLYLGISLLFVTASLLLKPYAIFFALPMLIVAYKQFGFGVVKQWVLYLFAIVAVIPLLWWRQYITAFPEGIPANDWLFNGNGIRFRPSFFRWMVYERTIKLISGYAGTLFLVVGGLSLLKNKNWLVFSSFILSSILYVTILATGNVQHDYYQIVILPTLAMMMGLGAAYLFSLPKKFGGETLGRIILLVCVFATFYFAWKIVQGYYWINNPAIVSVGKKLDKTLPKDALVVAPYTGDTSFLYQINRKGWPSFQDGLPSLVTKGADYLVIIHPTPQDEGIGTEYKIITNTKEYLLFDLHQKP